MTELRGIAWEHPRGIGGVRAASEEWVRTAPQHRVHWEPRSLRSFGDTPIADLARGRDLVIVDHPNMAAAVGSGAVLALDDLIDPSVLGGLEDRFVGSSWSSYRVEGRHCALPIDAAAQVSAFRPDLIARPPSSWPGVLELADEGRVLWPGVAVDAFSSLCTLLAQRGQPLSSGAGAPDQEVLGETLALLRRLVARQPRDALTMNPIAVAEELATGERFLYSPLLFGYTNYSRVGFRPNRVAYRDIPDAALGGSLLGGAGVAVSADSRDPYAAASLAVHLASDETQRGAWFAGGGQPARIEAWDDDELDERTLGFFSGTRRSIESAWVRPAHARWPEVQSRIAPLITEHLAGALPEASLIDTITDSVSILGESVDADH